VHLVDEWLEELLKQSDVVVTAAPSTPRTRGMLGEKQFAAMKRGSYLISVSRGKLVQTDALVSALREDRLAGAGLDVTDPEPLPADHALWDMPNVIITSHTAGQSAPGSKRVREVFLENARRHVAGLPLLNVVDKRKGY
jgi:phosphoglycerate dehydrogenase-like enzyme